MVTAPGWAWWEPNEKGSGEWVVEQRPDLVLQGHDPQLEKAIELVKEALKSAPAPSALPEQGQTYSEIIRCPKKTDRITG